MRTAGVAALLLAAAVVVLLTPNAGARKTGSVVVFAAGDIASCGSSGDEQTAALISRRLARGTRATVLTLGDNAYDRGTPGEFARCYEPSWGRFRARTRPTAGNHDYLTAGARGFLSYFRLPRTYYAFTLGSWRLYALDSERISQAQIAWLTRDLRRNRRRCVLAYWHRPRFSSGPHGDYRPVSRFWEPLYAAHADIILSGHDHAYERFVALNPRGQPDSRGPQQFVVGTGGKSLYHMRGRPHANSLVFQAAVSGVLRLDLRPGGYAWRFLATRRTFSDSGAGRCR
jgi:acid phosphatase type 7